MRLYPRLRVWFRTDPGLVPCWYVGLYRAEHRLVRGWWCFDYGHAVTVAPQIWADRAIWLER
jgi:hypothetical protein